MATRKYRQVSGTVSEAVDEGYSALSRLAAHAREVAAAQDWLSRVEALLR